MKKIGMILAGILVAMGLAMPMLTEPVMAVTSDLCNDPNLDQEQKEAAGCGDRKDAGEVASAVIQVALGFIGVVAVCVVIYGGFLFLMSSGDAGRVKKGQDAIKYGLIGLVVSILAYAIVTFVSMALA